MSVILVVDDEDRNLRLIEALLEPAGYEIVTAVNGEEALEKMQALPIDLVLLDIMMPTIDGFEVCRRIKEMKGTEELPVIFLTAKTDSESIVRGFGLGAVDFITKPFRAPELIARVDTHIRLRETQRELKAANETKNRFFNIIAHDLKGPFSSLFGYTDMLLRKFDRMDDERKLKIISTLRQSSVNTFKLLENLLEWSKQQSGQLDRNPEMIDLHRLCNSNVELFKQPAADKGIELCGHIAVQSKAYGDLHMLNLVVRNLISNAMKFTDQGGRIEVSSRSLEDFVEVTVLDTGVGIPEENIDSLFHLETHFTTHGTRDEMGSGLGLILCREFVELNGGTIRVESEVGRGSRFIFTIPSAPPVD